MRTPDQEALCEASGRMTSDDALEAMLYTLMRDHLPVGTVAELVRDATATRAPCEFTNGWLAQYAKHLAAQLRRPEPTPAERRTFTEAVVPKPGSKAGAARRAAHARTRK